MPNKLLSLLFPFIPQATLLSVFWLILIFLFVIPAAPFLPPFPHFLLLKYFLFVQFSGPSFCSNFPEPFPYHFTSYLFLPPLKSSINVLPFVWNLTCDLLLYIFYIHMPFYFLMTPDFKGIPGGEESWFSPHKLLRKILCVQPLIVRVCPGCWYCWPGRVGVTRIYCSQFLLPILKSSFLDFLRTTTYSTNTYGVTIEHNSRLWQKSDKKNVRYPSP